MLLEVYGHRTKYEYPIPVVIKQALNYENLEFPWRSVE